MAFFTFIFVDRFLFVDGPFGNNKLLNIALLFSLASASINGVGDDDGEGSDGVGDDDSESVLSMLR